MITITAEAETKAKTLRGENELGLRVKVQGGGCSGMIYDLSFDEHTDKDMVFHTKNNFHASNSVASKSSHYKNITFGSKEELIDAINSFKSIDRKEIQDMTWEKHAHIKRKKHFENCVDKTIEKFKSKR